MASTPSEHASRALRIAQEEKELAARTARGDRAAFDQLFDRYFNRVAWQLRDLPEPESQAAIWEALEQIFAGLEASKDTWLAARAYRIACASRAAAAARFDPAQLAADPPDDDSTPRSARR